MISPRVGVNLCASKEPTLGLVLTVGLAPGDSYGTQGLLYFWAGLRHRIDEMHHRADQRKQRIVSVGDRSPVRG